MTGNLILNFIWNVIIAAGFFSCVAMAARMWFRFPDRTKDDVVDFLIHLDLEKAENLLDPIAEDSLRRTLSPAEFRIQQYKRIHLYIEFLQRMAHNAAILVQWGNVEGQRRHQRTEQLANELQQEAVKVRAYSLLALMKLRIWLLMRLGWSYVLPTPHLSELRQDIWYRRPGSLQPLENRHRMPICWSRKIRRAFTKPVARLEQPLDTVSG